MAVSDRTLQKYWRLAVLLLCRNRCVICGKRRGDHELECHHVIARRKRVLRHDPANGVAVCIGECHQKAHTEAGKLIIWDEINPSRRDWLIERENVLVKDFRKSMSFSQSEHENWEKKRLQEVIDSNTPNYT